MYDILFTVKTFWPLKDGMAVATYNIAKYLIRKGYTVQVATSKVINRTSNVIDGIIIYEFEIDGNEVSGYVADQNEVNRYKSFISTGSFDLIVNFAAEQWATDICFSVFNTMQCRKVLVPTGFASLFVPEYKDYYNKMKERVHFYDACIFLSANYRDIKFINENGYLRNYIIPNGAASEEFDSAIDKSKFRQDFDLDNRFIVLHIGSFTGIKGQVEAAKIFLKSNLNKATLVFITDKPKELRSRLKNLSHIRMLKLLNFIRASDKQILVLSLSRRETVDFLKVADCFLFPSNLECSPLVLFESMAAGSPFLSTDVGNAREIVEWGGSGEIIKSKMINSGLIVPDLNDGANKLTKLFKNEALRLKMSQDGRMTWQEKFTWEVISDMYANLFTSLLKRDGNYKVAGRSR